MKKIDIKRFIRRLFPVKTMSKATKTLPKTIGKTIRGGVYSFLILVYIFIMSGIVAGVHDTFTYPDPNRPNVSLATIKAEEKQKAIDDKKAEEQKKLEEEATKKEAEDKAKLEKEEADKKAEELKVAEELKKQEEQKKLEEEKKVQEAKKVEEERIQQERQAKAEQKASSNNSNSSGNSHNHIQYNNGHTPYEAGYWIANQKKKIYHSDPTCSNMYNPIKITENEAKKRGMRHCKKC